MARPVREVDPPLTDAELAEMRPAQEVFSPEQFAALTAVRKRGRPASGEKKVPVTIRLNACTVAAFKATGAGWQTRMDSLLTTCAPASKYSKWVKIDPSAKGGVGSVVLCRSRRATVSKPKPAKARA